MKYTLMIILVVAFTVGCGGEKQEPAMSHDNHAAMEKAAAPSDQEKLIYYTCPTLEHKHIHSPEAGECPECGSTLVKGVVTSKDMLEYWGCPMLIHSHIRHDEAGRCAECKMELKPMRLVQPVEAEATE